jgi:hypothetical protein
MVVGNRNRIPANQIEGHRWESIPYVELVCHGFMLGRSQNPGQRKSVEPRPRTQKVNESQAVPDPATSPTSLNPAPAHRNSILNSVM